MCKRTAGSRATSCNGWKTLAAGSCVSQWTRRWAARGSARRSSTFSGPRDVPNFKGGRIDRRLTWQDLDWLRSFTHLPVVLKGIMSPEDGARAAQEGMAGVIVSNHGGRNLDTLPATIEALPAVAEKVAGRIPCPLSRDIRVERHSTRKGAVPFLLAEDERSQHCVGL
jgi:hypothetical protein